MNNYQVEFIENDGTTRIIKAYSLRLTENYCMIVNDCDIQWDWSILSVVDQVVISTATNGLYP